MSYFYLIPALGIIVGYAYFFYRRTQAQKAGGYEAYNHARLDKLFKLPQGERVTAVWSAVTIPKKNTRQKVTEVASAVIGAAMGGRIEYVGRPLGIACTTGNRVVILDKEGDVVQAYGPNNRPRFVETGKKGTKRPSQMRIGWDEGAIVGFEIPGEDLIEIDILASAVPILAGWSRGVDVSRLSGPIPVPETI